jgi:hypothetical protein
MKQALTSQFDSRSLPTAAIFDSDAKGHNAPVRSHWLALVMLLQLATASAAPAAERPVVREVLVSKEGTGARIEIRADQALAYRSYLMPGLEKWVIDLPGANTTYSEDESKKMRTPPLERITVRQKEVNGDFFTRIGLDFKGEVNFSLTADPVDKGRLVALISPSTGVQQKLATSAASSATPQLFAANRETSKDNGKPSGFLSGSSTAARTVTNVSITADLIRIETDGEMAAPEPLLLNRPGRLVLDLAGVTSQVRNIAVPANSFGIMRSRLGENAGKLRIVFEVSGDTFPAYRIRTLPKGLEIIPTTGLRRN